MKALVALALAAAPLPAAAQGVPDPVARWRPWIAEAAARFALPPDWIERVMRAESAGRTHIGGRPIRSRVGAIGLMQLMPATWGQMRAAYGLGHNPDDPRDNIMAGAAYLRLMYDHFGYPGLFAAYNAGPGRYAAVLAGRSALPGETRAYLAGLTAPQDWAAIAVAAPSNEAADAPPQSLFLLRYDAPESRKREPDSAAKGGLFIIRKRDQ